MRCHMQVDIEVSAQEATNLLIDNILASGMVLHQHYPRNLVKPANSLETRVRATAVLEWIANLRLMELVTVPPLQ